MDTGRLGLLARLTAEKTQLEAEIKASETELQAALRSLQVSAVGPVADKIRALDALRSRLAEVNTLLGRAEAEGEQPEAGEE